ncbi:dihydroneopterin aldolase [Anaerovibrio sp.]|uniref:dihydroneopterin aldolase n=1 Tax=Anaerovibrio sp. TaxID=1872532 RepID=UPI0025C36387|nr:dihydroneopterin aldolase [Anaerovibrio sp.]MBR2142919.1 dihydroneopterin aldolase [Anaerovibrio sp.]
MAKVKIVNMMFYGFHGMYEYEREQGQKFYFDVEATTKDDKVVESDDVADTVDSSALYAAAKEACENKRFHLLQALAGHIGDRLINQHPVISEVKVTIRKQSVPIPGPLDYVQIEVVRKAK